MKPLLFAIGICCWLAACGSNSPTATRDSGVQGIVTIGPSCPVERINSPCPPRPIAAAVVVLDASGTKVTQFVSGADGRFKLQLKPGSYTLVGISHGPGGLPRPIPVSVVVTGGSYATVSVQFDSGIR